MDEYVVQAELDAQSLEAEASAHTAHAHEANDRRENYTLVAVFFATVIFLAALATKLENPRLRAGILNVSLVVFVATTLTIIFFPVEL